MERNTSAHFCYIRDSHYISCSTGPVLFCGWDIVILEGFPRFSHVSVPFCWQEFILFDGHGNIITSAVKFSYNSVCKQLP